jgi:hypothetical protein
MVGITVLAKAAVELLSLLVTIADIGKLFNVDAQQEETDNYEKLRRHALSRHVRKTSGDSVHKDTEQRSTVLPHTRCVLHVQISKHDASKRANARSGEHTRKHVRYELSIIRTRKRSLDSDN